jgi:hypothetical protein
MARDERQWEEESLRGQGHIIFSITFFTSLSLQKKTKKA